MSDEKSIFVVWRTPIILVVGLLVLLLIGSADPNLAMGIGQIVGGAWGLWCGSKWISNLRKKK